MSDPPPNEARTEPDLAYAETQAATPRVTTPPIGKIDRFILLSKIGAGGMGVVYAAWDPELDRRVAIKVLHAESGSEEALHLRKRLIREAKAMARLSHPNIVPIYESREHEGSIYVVMEFVEGTTLAAWRRLPTPKPYREVLRVYRAAGRGLAAAHAAGFVHRDFKPENVLLGKDGSVKVSDFGIVRAVSPARAPLTTADVGFVGAVSELISPLTAAGSLMGTPTYMAPEQYNDGPISAKTDQFAFCVALWEALFGERPYSGESVTALAFSVLSGSRRTPKNLSRVPSRIRRALERGLEVDPSARWRSMDDLLAALETGPRAATYVALIAGTVALAALTSAIVVMVLREAGQLHSAPPAPVTVAKEVDRQAPKKLTSAIQVEVTPVDALVIVDGTEYPGSGIRIIENLTPGLHRLTIRHTDEYLPIDDLRVELVAGATLPFPVTLPHRSVRLRLQVEPANAEVFLIDGKTRFSAGRAGEDYLLERQPRTSYSIEAQADGYVTDRAPISFSGDAEQTVKLALVLDPRPAPEPVVITKTATLKIGCGPGLPPASVWLDGKKQAKPTVLTAMVKPGDHRIKWKWPDGRTALQTVTVADKETKVVKGQP